MSLWRQLGRGLRALVHRADTDREVADEVAHYLDQAAAAHRARGLSAARPLGRPGSSSAAPPPFARRSDPTAGRTRSRRW